MELVTVRAAAAAAHFSQRAGVEVHALDSVGALRAAADLLADIWQTSREAPPINADVMRALAHTGNYVVGVYAEGSLVGASVAFRSGSNPAELHSHISGVASSMQNRGAGFALKLHQRSWALERGIDSITWTMDPLVRRNVLFNLAKLRADVVEYLPNFYGAMRDGINASDQSDRLLMAWRLSAATVVAASERPAAASAPVDGGDGRADTSASVDAGHYLLRVGPDEAPVVAQVAGPVRRCELPTDIVAMRSANHALAAAWRHALRETLGRALESGWRVARFDAPGDYVLVRAY